MPFDLGENQPMSSSHHQPMFETVESLWKVCIYPADFSYWLQKHEILVTVDLSGKNPSYLPEIICLSW